MRACGARNTCPNRLAAGPLVESMMQRRGCALAAGALQLAAISAAAVTPAGAQDFYQGKTLTIVIGNTAGSGYDTYGRMVAEYMAKYLPGKPGVLAQNMPGAGAVRAADFLYSIAPKDGTTSRCSIRPRSSIRSAATRPSSATTRTKFEYIGTAESGTRVCFTTERSPVKTFEDAQKTPIIVAATQPAAVARLIMNLTGAKFQIVTGYPGPNEVFLAIERGEADSDLRLRFQRGQHAPPRSAGEAGHQHHGADRPGDEAAAHLPAACPRCSTTSPPPTGR